MTIITIQLESPIRRTFRAMQVAGMFDVPIEQRLQHTLTAEVPSLDEPWRIGAIVGPSGSGKTTLAKAAFGEALVEANEWPGDAAIVECLGEEGSGRPEARPTMKEIARILTVVGLGSVPTWLKPYRLLSTGEKFRADLALALLGSHTPVVVIDEFTSSLDRTIAMTVSGAVGRLIRGARVPPGRRDVQEMRFVAVTCHEDILPWLAPDWVVRLDGTDGAELTRGGLRRSEIRLPIRQVPQAIWSHFARHHYLAGGLARSATCYAAFWPAEECRVHESALGIDHFDQVNRGRNAPSPGKVHCAPLMHPTERPVAFCAAVAALGWKKTKRITRLVTLPEFQGLGIASRLLAIVAQHESTKGNRVTITASHPAILSHCQNSPHWRFTGHKPAGSTTQTFRGRQIGSSVGRGVVSFEFIPSQRP
jgi:GNAT superfamily N-acetyltransferase